MSRKEETKADKSRHEQTRADKIITFGLGLLGFGAVFE
jgi:hypothetical protein